jgi:putative NADPH-quinone reductase
MTRTLVVVCHPNPASLTRAAAERVLAGLAEAGHEARVVDLDREGFDPVLRLAEVQGHLGHPADRPDLADHVEALRWAERLVLVYPTWFSGQPARLKGWFDRVWMHQVAFVLPDGASRIRGRLGNIRRIDVVTSHGSTRRVNFLQGQSGRIRVRRTLRVLCHPLCRTTWTAVYDVDNKAHDELSHWLDQVGRRFAGRCRSGPISRRRPPLPPGPGGGPRSDRPPASTW